MVQDAQLQLNPGLPC